MLGYARLCSDPLSCIIMASILHVKVHTTYCLRLSTATSAWFPIPIQTPTLSSHGQKSSQSSPSSIMALEIMSATTSSSTSSFGCIDNFYKPPSSVQTRPSKSSISNSTNNLLPPLNSYLPMPCSEIDLKYIPIDPLYLPRHHPSLPFRLGEDISRMGAGTWYIGITAREPTLTYLSLRQDGTLLHYS